MSASLLSQALALAYAAGVSPYATVLLLGLVARAGWIGTLPGGLHFVENPFVLGIAGVLYAIEFVATLVPGVASVWETMQTFVRPPAAAVLAGATVWDQHGLAALAIPLGAALGLTTHGTKLGMRYAIDTSPEPVTNGAANVAELGVVAALVTFVWMHPFLSLGAAIVLLVLLIVLVRAVWTGIRNALRRLRTTLAT